LARNDRSLDQRFRAGFHRRGPDLAELDARFRENAEERGASLSGRGKPVAEPSVAVVQE
jgi:hypothetical protein